MKTLNNFVARCGLALGVLTISSATIAQAQQIEYARKVIKTLASPAFKGRGYVENGDKIASAFIAGEFKKSKLIPLNNGSYYQDFNLPANTFPGVVELKLNGQLLTTAVDYLISASSPEVHGTYPVIAVKRADINTVDKMMALVQRSKDGFILLDDRADAAETEEQKRNITANIASLKSVPELDFKGLIVYTTQKLTWTSLTFQSPRPVFTINKKDFNPADINTITANVDVKFIPEYTTRNVCGMIKGTSGSDSTIVISSHFDHLGLMGKKVYFPGANDNASGVSLMLSFVRHYAAHPPKYNTVFLGFSGEEIGILGSKAFVANPLIPLNKIKFLVNFDLAGTGEEGIKIVNGTIFRKEFDKIVDLNKEYKLVPKVEIRGEACKSDHCWFYEKGVPSFFIYTQGGIAAYHDIYDRSETLPLTEFEHYFQLMVKFFDTI
jgi:aminopeptidase YwaD